MKEYEVKFFLFERPLRMKVIADSQEAAEIEARKRVPKNMKVVSAEPVQPKIENYCHK
jgi:hypothetical protein